MFLARTLSHLTGIGPTTEAALHRQGIRDWDAFESAAAEIFSPERADLYRGELEQSRRALARDDRAWFSARLPREQLWRLIPADPDDIAYLDIETTGMGRPPAAHSTCIAVYWRNEVLQAVEPEDKRLLLQRVADEAKLLVTYFGAGFDVPFLLAEMGDLPLGRMPHLDLCPWLRRLGYKGGLKKIQKMFPAIPQRLSMDLDGWDAVRLWRLHRRGVAGALETLLTYNAEDTVVLEPLLREALRMELERGPGLEPPAWPERGLPELKTRIWPSVYEGLRQGEASP